MVFVLLMVNDGVQIPALKYCHCCNPERKYVIVFSDEETRLLGYQQFSNITRGADTTLLCHLDSDANLLDNAVFFLLLSLSKAISFLPR